MTSYYIVKNRTGDRWEIDESTAIDTEKYEYYSEKPLDNYSNAMTMCNILNEQVIRQKSQEIRGSSWHIIRGIDKALLLADLWGRAKPECSPLDYDDADRIVKEKFALVSPYKFEKLLGKVLNVDISADLLDPTEYEIANGTGLVDMIIEDLRKEMVLYGEKAEAVWKQFEEKNTLELQEKWWSWRGMWPSEDKWMVWEMLDDFRSAEFPTEEEAVKWLNTDKRAPGVGLTNLKVAQEFGIHDGVKTFILAGIDDRDIIEVLKTNKRGG